ncbi:hypothetical protein Ssi03_54610 [Sphaerisporangium siamense]|uniref:Coenzyme Q-binding protein COQ10 START domain-containing protein n=1 Tax=Sphaerisporangium siamense TaxID=795645 RepID=A0A7W7DDR8_9ACTN|nr:SRPBCC family protein [Sphaerisporangium siamense]MBB4703533.1 hypothetical protein [Sphaerisporangium siamense]GII87471.1 hypothetical protein Ssi03_54610 [Sphaerisporangium siamense]
MADDGKGGLTNPLKQQIRGLAGVAGKLALSALRRKVERTTKQLTSFADGDGFRTLGQLAGAEGGGGRVKGLAKMAWGGLKRRLGFGKRKLKFANIVESVDIGAPVDLVYNVWTQFTDWPTFTKKIEKVTQDSDEKITWQVQVFLPRRTWEATITEQVPDEKIVWSSKGAKGYVDGSVTFHALAPAMTRVLMSLEYHPKGLIEHIGNWWRAPGRRVRLEFKHIRRHIMVHVLPDPSDIQGWRGVIHEGEVVKDHETAVREEEEERERAEREEEPEEETRAAEEGEEEEPEEELEEGEEAEEGEEGEEPEGEEEPEEERGRARRRLAWGRRGERGPRSRPAEEEGPPARRGRRGEEPRRPREEPREPGRHSGRGEAEEHEERRSSRRGSPASEERPPARRRRAEGEERPVRRRRAEAEEPPPRGSRRRGEEGR